MASWIDVDPITVQLAMKEYERLGMLGARKKFGFSSANGVHMYYRGKGKPFEARVLIAIAHSIKFPDRAWLQPVSFTNLGTIANRYLETIGFEARPIVRMVKPPKPAAKAQLRRVA